MDQTKFVEGQKKEKSFSRRVFLQRTIVTGAGLSLMGVGSALYVWHVEPGWFEVTEWQIRLPRLSPAFDGYRIAHLSDLHIDTTWMQQERLQQVIDITNALQADMIVVTGDFVTSLRGSVVDTLSLLSQLKAPDGVFAVLGNHDYWTDGKYMSEVLERYAIHELKNNFHTLRRGDDQLHILGLDDLWPESDFVLSVWMHQPTLEALLEKVPEEGAAILLVHEPDFADVAAATKRIDLQLSGHSHGGQVRIPWLGAPILPPLGKKYYAGPYQIEAMHHYTSRGLGMVSPQVRLNCRPEIVLITCQSM